jgi:integrase
MKLNPRFPKHHKHPKTRLRLPDLEFSKTAVLNSLSSVDGQRGYGHAIDEFVDWYCSEPRLARNRTVVLRYRSYLEARQLAPGTVNLRLGAVRRLACEAADSGLLSSDLAAGIRRVKGVRNLGIRLGNWLTVEQSIELCRAPDGNKLNAKRDRALLAILLACGLRRHEAVGLRLEHLDQREEHWAVVDQKGKAGHVRTVPVPMWVMEELRVWLNAAGIERGRIFRRVTKMGKVLGEGITEKAVWHIVKDSQNGLGWTNLHPMTFGALAPASAMLPEVSWNRSSFFWGTFPFRRRNATWAASSEFGRRSMIELESNLVLEQCYSGRRPVVLCSVNRS